MKKAKHLLVLMIISFLMISCLTSNNRKKSIKESFTKQEQYLLDNLTYDISPKTKEDSIKIVQECTMEITFAMLKYPDNMSKFPKSYEYTDREDYLYKQYKYALKVFKEKGTLSLKELMNKRKSEYQDIYDAIE